ncbi:sigma-70 family RNA polymerase sigma factor [Paraflavitalea soli]|uniref:Sigma-70 family RNA polymerase sigma factor n=1 Tax=Paraflavitalea soli TaxID=2315862 RepID=A0A3B7MT78_9BACT|nr:sigma-70 family RNA polymerase sigma factor [Paraflavitalea soli]AXY73701.1 sigma-70 family RNA polymerase sigma factor [Paraflavitalea soli]
MPSERPFNEQELLSRLAHGDKSAFDTLYQYYEPRLRLFLYPFTAYDTDTLNSILQDVFLKLWLKRTDLVGIALLEFYLQRMAKNKLLDTLRLSQIRERHESGYARLQTGAGDPTTEQLQLKEYMDIAREGMAQMPERRRLIFTLYIINGLSLDEVAAQLNLSKEVVKKQLQLAKVFLKEYIAEKGDLPLTIAGLLLLSLVQ